MKMSASRVFDSFSRRIGRAHKKLGHKQGWRFLYTPKKTLSSKSEIVFVGLNPGGGCYERPIASVKNGNAYRVEPWGKIGPSGEDRQLNPLQQQVCKFYDLLASVWPGTNRDKLSERLMDGSLSSNFYPFRSRSIKHLKNKNNSALFATDLWSDILDLVVPKLIITMGNDVRAHFDELLTEKHGGIVNPKEFDCDWSGKCTYRLAFTRIARTEVLLISLPHLSVYKIFGREKHKRIFAPLVKTLKRHLKK